MKKNLSIIFVIITIILIISTFFVKYNYYNDLKLNFENNNTLICNNNLINKKDGFEINGYTFINIQKNKSYNISKCYLLRK